VYASGWDIYDSYAAQHRGKSVRGKQLSVLVVHTGRPS